MGPMYSLEYHIVAGHNKKLLLNKLFPALYHSYADILSSLECVLELQKVILSSDASFMLIKTLLNNKNLTHF